MSNSFERQIKDKLNSAEMTPSEGLLDSIFEKRAAKAKPGLAFGKMGWVLAASIFVVTATVWLYYNNESKTVLSGVEKPEQVINEAESPIDVQSVQEAQTTDNAPLDLLASKQQNQTHAKMPSLGTKPRTRPVSAPPVSHQLASNQNADHSTNYNANTRSNEFSSNIDPNAYFNVDAKNRPLIDRERHIGNSHMYVYHAVNPQVLDDLTIGHTATKGIQKFNAELSQREDLSYRSSEVKNTKSPISRTPYFIDLMYLNGFNSFKATDGFHASTDYNATNAKGNFNQFGIRVSRPISGPWTMSLGFNQANIRTAYKGALNYSTENQVIHTNVHYINDPIKGVIRVETKDTQMQTVYNTQNVNHSNSYSLFRVPVGFAYNFGIGKLQAGLMGSLDFNYLKSSKGFYYDYENHTVKPFSSSKGSLNVGASFSVMAMYKLGNKFGVFVEPGLQFYNIRSKSSFHAVNESVKIFNLGFGLRYIAF